jgi:hypothetical protein
MKMTRTIGALFVFVTAVALSGCRPNSMYVGTTFGAPWGGVSVGTSIPLGRPCCRYDDDDNDTDAAEVTADAPTGIEANAVPPVRPWR